MDVLMACSELSPIARVGGLADAVAALAKTLCQFEHRVTIALPRYASIEQAGLMLARRLTPAQLEVGNETVQATLFDARLGSGVELLLFDIPSLYDRPGIYGADGAGYDDNARRFGLFCRAVAEVVRKRDRDGRPFDVVHAHDWPAALLPYLLRDSSVRTVLTVHDAVHQGQFSKEAIDSIGLDWSDFHPAGLEYYGQLNMLKGGALAADAVTTVSPSYAQHIQTTEGGAGLDGVFRARGEGLVGILNCVDYAVWSPTTDPHLTARFDAEDVTNKARCKASFLHERGLAVDPELPLVVSVGTISHARGSDLVADALEEIVRTGAQIVVGGEGEATLSARLEQAAQREAGAARFLPNIDESVKHQLVAAADLVLLPHRNQPCGTLQQIAQRYGALPVAHAVGGLRDTIVDCDAQFQTGTGFLFEEPSATALVAAVQRAVAAMHSPRWPALRRRVMRLDLSWERSARRYAKLYQRPVSS